MPLCRRRLGKSQMPSSSARPSISASERGGYSCIFRKPSPRRTSRWGEPIVSRQRKKVLSRGRLGKWRSPNAFIPSLKDSSEPAESRITRIPAAAPRRSRCGQRQQGDDRGAVVVGAGDDLRSADLGHRRRRAEAEQDPELGEQAPAGEGAERGQDRSADDRRHQRRAGVGLLDQPEAVGDLRNRRVEDEAGVGGVVVGDEDDRPLRLAGRPARRRRCRWCAWAGPGAAGAGRAGSRRRSRRRRSRPARRRAGAARAAPRCPPSAPSAAPIPSGHQ